MGLNFLGLGFAFGAKDMGMSKVQAKIAGGFTNIVTQMGQIHEASKPAFAGITSGLDGIDAELAAQEPAIAAWAQKWATNIEGLSSPVDKLREGSLKPLFDKAKEGSKAVSMAWNSTFGESFKKVGEGVNKVKARFEGIKTAVSPLTKAIKKPFAKVGPALKGFKGKLAGIAMAAANFGSKMKGAVADGLQRAGSLFKSAAGGIWKSAKKIWGGFDGIRGGVDKMNSLLRVNKLKGFLSAVSLGTLSKISGALGQIGSNGMNLSTGLEATMVGLSKSSRHAAANLGLTGSELSKVSSQAAGMAHGLNIGADGATQAIVGYKDATKELGAVGVKSASELALLNETFGVNSTAFSKQLIHLKKLGLGDKELKKITSSFFNMGKATRDVGGALNSLPEIMGLIETKMRLAGKSMDPKQIAAFASGTAGAAAAFGKFGIEAGKARSAAIGLATSQVSAQEGFDNLFQGIGNDIPDFMKEMNVMGMSQEKVFKLMQGGPDGMLKGFKAMLEAGKKTGADVTKLQKFFGARMKAAGIDNADMIVNFLSKGDDAAFAMMDTAQKTTVNLGKLAKAGHSTGRTLQESFDLAKEAAIAHFRAGSKASGSFLKDFTKSASAFNKILDETSKEGGPLGNFVDKLRDVHRLGTAGLLPKEMQGAGILLGEIVNQLGPLLGIIGGAIMFFPGLTAVLGPVVAVLGLFAINVFKARLAGESWSESMRTAFKATVETLKKAVGYIADAFDLIVDTLVNLTTKMAKWASAFDWKGFFKRMFSKIGKAVKGIIRTLAAIGRQIMGALFGGVEEGADKGRGGKILGNIMSVFKSMFGGLVEAVKEIDWSVVITTLANGLAAVLKGGNKLLKKINFGQIASKVFDLLGKGLSALGDKRVGDFLGSIAGFLIKRAGIVAQALLDVIEAALDWLSKADLSGMLTGIMTNIQEASVKAIDALIPELAKILDRLPGLLEKAAGAILKTLKELPAKLGDFMKESGPRIKGALKKLIPVLMKGLVGLFKFTHKKLPQMIIDAVPGILAGLWEFLKGAVSLVWDILSGIGEGLGDGLEEMFPGFLNSLGKFFVDIYEGFVDAFNAIVDGLYAIFVEPWVKLWELLTAGWDMLFGESGYFGAQMAALVKFATKIWTNFKATLIKLIQTLTNKFKRFFSALKTGWDRVKKKVLAVWTSVKEAITNAIKTIKTKFNEMRTHIAGIFKGIYDKAKLWFEKIETKIKSVWTAIKGSWDDGKTYFNDLFKGIWAKIRVPFDEAITGMKNMWDGPGGLKEKWDKAKAFFKTLFESIGKVISKSMAAIKSKLTGALKPIQSLFDTIWKLVEKLWVNSMHHEAEKSGKATLKVHEAVMPKIAKEIDPIGFSIEKNFNKAFAKATAATKKFEKDVVPLIEKIAKSIAQSFFHGLNAVAQMVDTLSASFEGMMKKLDQQVYGAQVALKSLELAQKAAAEASKDARKELKKTAAKSRGTRMSRLSDLASHINDPEWYSRSGDGMKALMIRHHAEQQAMFAKMVTGIGAGITAGMATQQGGASENLRSTAAANKLKVPVGGARSRRVSAKPPSKK
jgi:phage-related protein